MEIPKAMQEEVNSMQNKLTNAILEHQMCVVKLKEDPNNSDIHSQKNQIQLRILSLGKRQKQIVERLRKAVQSDAADNVNGSKVSIASLWGLNNNNHIKSNNETKHETAVANGFETKPSKEHYEEVITNGDVPSPVQHNNCTKQSPSSVETISGEDDIVEVPMDESSKKEQEEMREKYHAELLSRELYLEEMFLLNLQLMATKKALELQNKRAERKRRSTANSQFVYSMTDQPAKRQKKVTYLQSGNAPHTRQTTARMNGPSPPPNKAQSTKSTSPQARATTKPLISAQKPRPNILRNNADSKVYVNKNKIEDKQTQSSVTSAKTIQIGGKTVHLPGLPSSLTIERIENNSVVCITCRNNTSGPLTVCETCSNSYHVTCHTMPAPPSTCPKCAIVTDLKKNVRKAEETEGGERMDGEKPSRIKGDKLEEKERERYELRERNSDLRLQVYELEKRSQLLGQSLQLQQRLRQELLGKQEKTQRSIKRLVDFIKLIQVRKSTSSPPPSASISSPPQPSSSQSLPIIPRTSSNPKMGSLPQSPTTSNDKTSYLVTPSLSVSPNDRASPTSKQRSRCPTLTSCQAAASSLKSINHTSLSKKSPSQVEGPTSLLAVKPTTKAILQLSTINCRPRPAAVLPSRPASSSPTPCSSAATTVRGRPPAQSQHSIALSVRKGFSPSRASTSWNEPPSMAESPGPSSHAVNSASVSNQPADPPQKPYSHPTATASRLATSTCKSQGPLSDHQRKQRASIAVLVSTGQPEPAPSSTHCSQAITGPISSPIVHASHEASAQTTETARSCGNNSVVWSTSSWSRANSQAAQQQSSSSGALSRGSSST